MRVPGGQLRPARERAAYISVFPSLFALEFATAIYRPPGAGALVSGWSADTAHSVAVVTTAIAAALAVTLRAPTFPTEVTPEWPGGSYDLTGTLETGTAAAGPLSGFRAAANTAVFPQRPLVVLPGNVLVLMQNAAGFGFFGHLDVHEFVNPDEFEAWNVGSVP